MFITFDGIDGAGKTTQMKKVADILKEKYNKEIFFTKEPGGGGKIGMEVRNIITSFEESNPISDLMFIYGARYIHVNDYIKPALSEGKVVLCDRFFDSSIVYYASHYGFSVESINFVKYLQEKVIDNFLPDLTFIIDVPVTIARQRIAERGSFDRFDQGSEDQLQAVREGFLKVANMYYQRCYVIDGTKSFDAITEQIVSIIIAKEDGHSSKSEV